MHAHTQVAPYLAAAMDGDVLNFYAVQSINLDLTLAISSGEC